MANEQLFALNEILTGLSQGLNDAQKQLRNMAPYDEYGRPNTLYQLPYLDFQLQVNSRFEEIKTTLPPTSNSSGTPTNNETNSLMRFGGPKASFKFSTNTTQQNTAIVELKSVISGRFVATLPNEGLPQTTLQVKQNFKPTPITIKGKPCYQVDIEVLLVNTNGEVLVDSLIEFNFDNDATTELNKPKVIVDPSFSSSEVKTNQLGIAITSIYLDKINYDAKTTYLFTIGFANIIKNISICNITI
jgi:hypothetical protein